MLKLAIAGAAGRMGQTLLQVIASGSDFTVSSAMLRSGHDKLGQAAHDEAAESIPYGTTMTDATDCLIDFTAPACTLSLLSICVASKTPSVIGTTGFDVGQLDEIEKAASQIPVLLAPNTSLGVNLILGLLKIAANAVGGQADIEIVEAHHRNKLDSPSGTALRMGEVIADTLGHSLSDIAIYGREGTAEEVRPNNQIGFSTIRAGDIVGDHSVLFGLDGEQIEITHKANNRELFAKGALRATEWLVTQPPGLYGMNDVLGLD